MFSLFVCLLSAQLRPAACKWPHLHTDHNDQRGCYGDGEGLLVRDVRAVVANGREAQYVRHEEEDKRGEDTVQGAGEELALVEEQVELPGPVQARVTQAEVLIHILGHTGSTAGAYYI